MNSKEYVMPDGKKAVFEYDHDGIGKVTIEAMDMLMGLITDGRKRGEWVDDDFVGQYRCSECDYYAIDEYDYCPNCGARMKGTDDEV